jgi:hypothetical protein
MIGRLEIENGVVVVEDEKHVTAECWDVQFKGLEVCKTCTIRGKDCVGKNIRKTGKNELGYSVPLGGKMSYPCIFTHKMRIKVCEKVHEVGLNGIIRDLLVQSIYDLSEHLRCSPADISDIVVDVLKGKKNKLGRYGIFISIEKTSSLDRQASLITNAIYMNINKRRSMQNP